MHINVDKDLVSVYMFVFFFVLLLLLLMMMIIFVAYVHILSYIFYIPLEFIV